MNWEDPAPSEHFKPGDSATFEALFNSHYPALCHYAKKFTGDMDKARDIVQDVFVSFYINCKTSDIPSSVKSYLYRSVHNACLNYIRQQKLHSRHHQTIKLETPDIDDQDVMIRMEVEQRIWSAIQNLPGQCGKIFRMNRFENRKNIEIAELLGLSVRTVETQISKALKILRNNLGDLLVIVLLSQFRP